MSRNDIVVILATAGPEFRVSSFCMDTLDTELYVCSDCDENRPCELFHSYDDLTVSRKAMAACFANAPFFSNEESAVRYAAEPGMDEYDVPEGGYIIERQTDVEFPWELLVSTA